ncbi:MAG: hypothetical protein PHS96_02700 [Anaerolineales bacterium]|nr:hypothetical protein [Anaerolineales bacterium]
METSQIQTLDMDGLRVSFRWPVGAASPGLLLLLHGWTGDERSMWIFTERLPLKRLILSPRGLYPAPGGGYSWTMATERGWPSIDDFRPAIDRLLALLAEEPWEQAAEPPWVVIGFSQGAALAYALALTHPQRVGALVGLSGFLPRGAEGLVGRRPLDGLPVFIAHGKRDELVEAEQARLAQRILALAGAEVVYCEEDVGHKLSRACFRGMEEFLAGAV